MRRLRDDVQLAPGTLVGEYRILDVVGDGGFSTVYRAEDTHLMRPVAIKQHRPEAFSEAGSREWFMREAQLTASLNHPNIVQIYGLREVGDSLLLIMEYLPGDLHTLVQASGPLDRAALLKVTTDVCRALETLHARGIIHRDIKPENILIAPDHQFKLADFGLAHVHPAQLHGLDDASGPQPGTLLYMSPEQALGLEIAPQSDIYSLAVVLYEAITGHYYLDFDETAQGEDDLLALITETSPLPLDDHHPSIPLELERPLLRALAKDPAERPATARAFLAEIKNAISRSRRASLSRNHASTGAQAPVASPELLRELYAIRTLRDAGHQPDTAERQLRTLLENHWGVPEVAAEWGETLVALGRIDEGRGWLETAVRRKPDLPFALLALADLYRDIDEDDEAAAEAVVSAIRIDPDLVYAVLYEEIVSSLDDSAYDGYLALFRRAASDGAPAPVLHNLGQVLALSQRHAAQSVRAFEAAIARDPDYGPAYVGLGSLLIELNQLDRAIPLLEQATYACFPDLQPYDWHRASIVYQRPHAFLALAVSYAHAGQFENSAVAARTVLDLAPRELDEDAQSLLDAYAQAARDWLGAGDALRAYRLLSQIAPLAAHWGHLEIFALLESTERQVDPVQRHKRHWDEVARRLASGLNASPRPTE